MLRLGLFGPHPCFAPALERGTAEVPSLASALEPGVQRLGELDLDLGLRQPRQRQVALPVVIELREAPLGERQELLLADEAVQVGVGGGHRLGRGEEAVRRRAFARDVERLWAAGAVFALVRRAERLFLAGACDRAARAAQPPVLRPPLWLRSSTSKKAAASATSSVLVSLPSPALFACLNQATTG